MGRRLQRLGETDGFLPVKFQSFPSKFVFDGRLQRPALCVPSMFDSLKVKVLFTT